MKNNHDHLTPFSTKTIPVNKEIRIYIDTSMIGIRVLIYNRASDRARRIPEKARFPVLSLAAPNTITAKAFAAAIRTKQT